MAYMTVKKQTEAELSLLREPSFLSKAVFIGFFVGIFGIFLFGSESFVFKVLIGVGAACLSCLIVDNYELCDLDKTKSEVRITRMHWFQHFMNQFNLLAAQPYVTANLKDIKDVRVEEQEGSGSGSKAYQVVLSLNSGIHLGITEVFTTDDVSVHEKVAKVIKNFLGCLPPLKADDEADDEQDEEEESDAGQVSSSASEDDFEQISRADLDDMEEEKQGVVPSTPLPGERDGAGDASGESQHVEIDGSNPTEVKTTPAS
ncbi:chromosome 17 open reading frame 62 [Plakobranchus ocellatus]|uniref:Essential for reactive oxygen species protein n=1 Tax=Plakobranchus ocellatus TaxID=259542 RepID=A0AAV4CB55_9GAST|nr:chromosome 17 open reading frame 62 [Plakobranchus ocellatus]